MSGIDPMAPDPRAVLRQLDDLVEQLRDAGRGAQADRIAEVACGLRAAVESGGGLRAIAPALMSMMALLQEGAGGT